MTDPRIEIAARAPCPFCGSSNTSAEREDGQYDWFVLCNNCHARGPWHRSEEQATDDWNERAVADAARPEVDGEMSKRVEAEIDRRLANPCGDVDYFICLMAQDKLWEKSARTAARAPAAPDAWQPIETAPRDGTRILGWAIEAEDDLMPQIIQWHQHKWVISHDITPMTGAKYFQLGSGEWEPTGHWEAPTHWKPLPKPPTEAAKDAKP